MVYTKAGSLAIEKAAQEGKFKGSTAGYTKNTAPYNYGGVSASGLLYPYTQEQASQYSAEVLQQARDRGIPPEAVLKQQSLQYQQQVTQQKIAEQQAQQQQQKVQAAQQQQQTQQQVAQQPIAFQYKGSPGIYSGRGTSTGTQQVVSQGTPQSFYSFTNKGVRKVTEPVFKLGEKIGITQENVEKGARVSSPFSIVGIGPFGFGGDEMRELSSGIAGGIYKDVREEPLKNVLLFGAGAGLGFGVSAVIGTATKLGGMGLGQFTQDLFSLTGVGLTGKYAFDIGKEVYNSPDIKSSGSIIGVGAKDIALIGAGGLRGQKAYQQYKGSIATAGRIEVPFEKLTTKEVLSGEDRFLIISKQNQLSSFREGNFGKAIEEPAGGFHTTPSRFSTTDLFKPQAGSSELPGTYIAPGTSPAFLKLVGSGSSAEMKLFSISASTGEPGIAYFEPIGFRKVGYKAVKPYLIDEQPFKYKFTTPPKQGIADLPLMKNEAEAVLRTDAGSYKFKSGKFYTTIDNVKVPIDVFKYEGELAKGDLTSFAGKSQGYSYSYPGKYSLISPEITAVGLSSSDLSSSKISKTSSILNLASSSELKSSYIPNSSYKPSNISSAVSNISSVVSKISNYSPISKSYPPSSKPYYPPSYSKSYVKPYTSSTTSDVYYPYSNVRKRNKPLISYDVDIGKVGRRKGSSYDVFKILKGKPTPIARGLSRGSALDIGTKEILGNLRATFILKKSDLPARDIPTGREFSRYSSLFREPVARSRYRKYGEAFIQKATRVPGLGTGRLTSRGEKLEIQSARRNKMEKYLQ